MDSLNELTQQLKNHQSLSKEEIELCINSLISEQVLCSEKEAFLTALSAKGETVAEMTSFVNCFLKLSKNPELGDISARAIDLCGTGGDKAGSFNISTFVSFILASSGIPVIKHGNRSISSKCGSADLIEAIGMPLEIDNKARIESLKSLNYSFLFAPSFHPAFKNIAPVRKELAKKGIITIFNILGPMINPAQPSYQLLGVYSESLVHKVSETLHKIGRKGGFIIHGKIKDHPSIKGIDEITSCGDNVVQGIGQNYTTSKTTWEAKSFGLEISPIEEIKGGNLNYNLKIMNDLLNNNASRGLTNSILMNASLAFMSYGRTKDLTEGVSIAKRLLRDGVVKNWLNQVTSFFK